MTAKTKKALKIIGIVIGVLALISGGIYLYFRFRSPEEEPDDNPYTKNYSTSVNVNSNNSQAVAPNPYSKYSAEEVKKMQSWLYWKGLLTWNKMIMDSISTTGGIDGIIGPGFKTALNEAIKQGYVTSIEDLYSKTKK